MEVRQAIYVPGQNTEADVAVAPLKLHEVGKGRGNSVGKGKGRSSKIREMRQNQGDQAKSGRSSSGREGGGGA